MAGGGEETRETGCWQSDSRLSELSVFCEVARTVTSPSSFETKGIDDDDNRFKQPNHKGSVRG